MPKQPKATGNKAKPDEKPWPRNVKIGAGVAACVIIPYTTIWFITSNPTLRETFGTYLPLDQLRSHFGSLEWDAQSFADQEEPIPTGCYQFPLELSFRERLQQAIIEQANQGMTTAKIYVLGDSQEEQVETIKQVPASTKANPEALASLVGARLDPGVRVAVVFQDPESSLEDSAPQDGIVSFDDRNEEDIPTNKSLLKETVTYSTWYYTPMVDEESAKAKRSSDNEIDRLRLEYTVKKLEKDLRDPTCTRDHDEMRAELKQAKSDLSRLKWKRRLGF
jgi:hypothetical protein